VVAIRRAAELDLSGSRVPGLSQRRRWGEKEEKPAEGTLACDDPVLE
jgi:hypothetical protein